MIYLSYSRLQLLSECPHRYYRKYVLKEPDVIGAPLIMGSAFHKAMEENFRHKLEHSIDLPGKEIAAIYRDEFDKASSKPLFEDLENLTEEQVDWGGEDPKELRAQGQKALLRYHKMHAPFLLPMMIEEKIQREVAEDVLFTGYLDLVTTTGVVIDFKLVAYPWKEPQIETALQPTCYAMLLKTPISFDYHFITKRPTTNVGISIRRTARTSQDISWLLNEHIPAAVRLINEEMWIRNPGAHCFRCPHRRGCGYRMVNG